MRRFGGIAALPLGFTALAVVMTWPLWRHPTRTLPSDLVDTVLNAWIIAWDAERAKHLFAGVWHTPIYFPYKNTLAFSENLLSTGTIVAPVYWLTGNPVLTYNVAFVLAFALAGVGAYLLALAVTGSPAAAVVGGIYYAFCPFRMAQISHIQMVATGWMPIALYGLHRYFATRRRRWLAVFVVGWYFQALANMYVGFFLALPAAFVAVEGLWYARSGGSRCVRDLALAAFALAIVFAPVGAAYVRVRADYGQVRNPLEINAGSADLRSYVVGKDTIGIWRRLPTMVPLDPEKELFPGILPLVLAAFAIAASARRRNGQRRWVVLYAAIAVAAIVCSLGPEIRAAGRTIVRHAPYELLQRFVPGFDGMRVPARFAIVVFLALSVLSAFGAEALMSVFRGVRMRVALTAALIVVLLAEGWEAPITVLAWAPRGRPEDRAIAEWLAARPAGAVLHFPVQSNDFHELNYQYATLFHGHPIVNGFSGYDSPLQALLADLESPLYDFDRFADAVRMLRALGVRYVFVHPGDYVGAQRALNGSARTLAAFRAIEHEARSDSEREAPTEREASADRPARQILSSGAFAGAYGFELAPWTAAPPADAALLDRRALKVTVSHAADRAAFVVDGDRDTRWIGPQDGSASIQATFDRTVDVARVDLQLAARSIVDYPRALQIAATDEQGRSTVLYERSPYPEFIVGFVRSAAYPSLSIELPSNGARSLTIRETAVVASRWWSVHEVAVWTRVVRASASSAR